MKNKIIIGLSISLMVCLIIIFFNFKSQNNLSDKNDKLLQEYEIKEEIFIKKIENRDKQIKELNKTEPKTEKEIIYKKIVEKDTELLNECQNQKELLKNQLEKTNEQYKKQINKNSGISLYTMAGISNLNGYLDSYNLNDLNVDLIVGIDYHKYFLNNRFSLDTGIYVKPYEQVGFGLKLGVTVNF